MDENTVVLSGTIKEINFFGTQVDIDLWVGGDMFHVLVLFDHHIDMLEANAAKGDKLQVVGILKTRNNKYDVYIKAEHLML